MSVYRRLFYIHRGPRAHALRNKMAVHYLRIQSLHSYMSLQVLERQVGDLELSSLL